MLVRRFAIAIILFSSVRVHAQSPYADAVVVDDVAILQTTQLVPRASLTPEAQVDAVFDQLVDALKQGGSDLSKTIRLHFYAAKEDVVPLLDKALAKRFPGAKKPAVTIVVGTPVQDGVAVSVDATAMAGIKSVEGSVVKREGVAILAPGPVYYISGQAERGKTLAEATRKTLASLETTIKHYDGTKGGIAQVKAFVHPMKEIANVRKEIATFFGDVPLPPITFVEWTFKDSIEIELVVADPIAKKAKPTEPIEYITPPGMTASPIYARVTRINHGKRLYTSGLHGKTKAVFDQLGTLLKTHGSDFRHLAKATYYVSTDESSKALNVIRPSYYDPKRPPAASKAPVRGVGRGAADLVLDMIAVVRE
jgi:enamine deaminase RidA (YjgF/YER057c/UK114 family)